MVFMNVSDILFTILISFLFLCVVYVYIYFLYNTKDTRFYKSYFLKHHASYEFKNSIFDFSYEDKYIITNIHSNNDEIEIPDLINNRPVQVLDVKDEIFCDTFIIPSNLRLIINLNLHASKVISNSNYFKVLNDMILDNNNNVLVIFKNKTKDELIEISQNYSISRNLMYKFTNAIYFQFVNYNKLNDLRLSKPYDDKNENLFIIVPKKINNLEVESLSINYSNIEYMYISQNIKRIILEKKVEFEKIDVNNPNYSIEFDDLFDIIRKEVIMKRKLI